MINDIIERYYWEIKQSYLIEHAKHEFNNRMILFFGGKKMIESNFVIRYINEFKFDNELKNKIELYIYDFIKNHIIIKGEITIEESSDD